MIERFCINHVLNARHALRIEVMLRGKQGKRYSWSDIAVGESVHILFL